MRVLLRLGNYLGFWLVMIFAIGLMVLCLLMVERARKPPLPELRPSPDSVVVE